MKGRSNVRLITFVTRKQSILWYPRPVFLPTLIYEQNPLGTSTFAFSECQEFWKYSAWRPSVWSCYHKRMPENKTSLWTDCRPHLLLFVTCRRLVRSSRSRLPGTASPVSGFDKCEGGLRPLSWTVQWNLVHLLPLSPLPPVERRRGIS